MKCCACHKEITGSGKLISCDGDFVCNDECHKSFHQEMDVVCGMSDWQFEQWITGRNEIYPSNVEVRGAEPLYGEASLSTVMLGVAGEPKPTRPTLSKHREKQNYHRGGHLDG